MGERDVPDILSTVTVGLRICLSVTVFSLNFYCLAKEAELFLEKWWMINPQPISPDSATISPDSNSSERYFWARVAHNKSL